MLTHFLDALRGRPLLFVTEEANVIPTTARDHHRRDRMAREGTLLQVDVSRHGWLEGRGPYMRLVGGIDDATGQVEGSKTPRSLFRKGCGTDVRGGE